MSGILNGIVTCDSSSFYWKLSLLLGMISTSSVFLLYLNDGDRYFYSLDNFRSGLSTLGFAISGIFVGIGTKLGNGCTSGHGVCGLPRFSKRSFAAVCSFMASSMVVANVVNLLKDKSFMSFLTETSDIK